MRCFEHLNREALASCVACGKGVCLDCLSKHGGKIYCDGCQPGGVPQAQSAPVPYAPQPRPQAVGPINMQQSLATTVVTDKNRYIAAVIAITLGSFGAHKFYVGQPVWGTLYFLFCWTGIPTLASMIETILYLTRTDEDFIRRYGSPMHHEPSGSVLFSPPSRLQLQTGRSTKAMTAKDYERFLLQFAQRHGGQISMAHLMAEADLRLDRVEDALARLSAKGMVQSEIDDQGHVRYYVQEFRES